MARRQGDPRKLVVYGVHRSPANPVSSLVIPRFSVDILTATTESELYYEFTWARVFLPLPGRAGGCAVEPSVSGPIFFSFL